MGVPVWGTKDSPMSSTGVSPVSSEPHGQDGGDLPLGPDLAIMDVTWISS